MGHSHHTGAAAEHHGPVLQLQFPGLRHGVGVGGWPPAQMGLWHQLAEDLGSVPCTGCLMMPVQDMPTWVTRTRLLLGKPGGMGTHPISRAKPQDCLTHGDQSR